ncbi:MAG: RNA polymerase sigma-70 factor [Bacteroidales bacterium]|nr:RNA polymerase sigma-70 factor [Bacteroidales bacterium]
MISPPKDRLKAFNEAYQKYYRKCFLFAKSYVHDIAVADDFASEAMVKLWENFESMNDVINIQAFLLTIVKNLSINYLRHEQLILDAHQSIASNSQREIELRISSLESCDPSLLFSEEVRQIFEETLASLPEQTRSIFYMSRIEDKSIKEIAQNFGISVKGVDYHIAKALKVLRVSLKDYLPSLMFLLY